MKVKIAVAVSLLCAVFSTAAFADYCINKDFTNKGTVPAFDIAITITGHQTPSWLYNGGFSNFSLLFQGANEVLHWQNFNGSNQPINPGQLVHVGWCTVLPNDMTNLYWTDISGNQIPGSIIMETGGHSANSSTPGVIWPNLFTCCIANVSNVSFALASTAWPLDQLNAQNRELAGQLKPLPGGTSFQIPPGKSFSLPVPGAVRGNWVVLVYNVDGSGSAAATTDYVQFQF